MDWRFELKKADKELSEAAEKYDIVKMHILRLDQDIFTMDLTISGLEENIETLKDPQIVAIASEFKKIKSELERARNRLAFLHIDRANYVKMLVRAERVLNESRAKYTSILSKPAATVIQGKFGKDDGQE